jgi:sugar O-acyltransferase (sialic acid O-acetyltransferase NeuD family)
MRPLVIAGIGGFGREVVDVVTAINDGSQTPRIDLLGLIDDHPSEGNLELLRRRGLSYLGTTSEWLATHPVADIVIGVANPVHRRTLDARLTQQGLKATTLVHPAASLGSEVDLAPGSIVCAGARLTTNIRLGRHAHVHVNATIGHDTTLEEFSSVYPLAAVSGSCVIASGATIGANATVIQGLTVGADAFVGAGAVVIGDILSGTIVKGVPAR